MMKLTGSGSHILYAVMHVAVVFACTQQGRIYSMLFPYYSEWICTRMAMALHYEHWTFTNTES